jgi:wyosine [tRNA(Phe)-imidazoG37] synthetase (radical SAM superfamily)
LVEAVFTDEDKRNLKTLAEELPKLRLLVEELMETLEILSDEKLMKSIRASLKDIQEKRLVGFKELLTELSLDEKEILVSIHQGISEKAKRPRQKDPN